MCACNVSLVIDATLVVCAGLAYVGLITIMAADLWQLALKLRKAARKGWEHLFQT